MINRFVKFGFLILLLLFASYCKNKKTIDENNQILLFKENIKEEPIQFLNDIANKVQIKLINYPSGIHLDGYCGIIFKQEISNNEFDSEVSTLKNNSLAEFKFSDDKKSYIPDVRKVSKNQGYPVPDFNDSWFRTEEKLDFENTVFFILKNEKGNYFSKDFLHKIANDKEYGTVKKNLGYGFSNGAAVDFESKQIFYWTIVW